MDLFSFPAYTVAPMYYALAYYCFVSIENPALEVERHKEFFKGSGVVGRIYLSKKGINGQMSALKEDAERYMRWLSSDFRFSRIHFKVHEVSENIFPRMTVKVRDQLVALDEEVDLSLTGERVSPEKWQEMLQSGGYLVLDVRNRYEWEIGHFEGARLPDIQTFREFPAYAEELAQQVDKRTKVMMYCTGGIRCELYSALLRKKGFDEVYQLDGGVIHYGQKQGKAYWKGKLFVFDDRLAIPIDGQEAEPISCCCHCFLTCDTYYNCANMDCNELFVACSHCVKTYCGCCSHGCKLAPRLRAFDEKKGNRPFRRKHLIDASQTAPALGGASSA